MVDQEKDRLGQKLKDRERAEEDRFFAERDKAALERLRAVKEGGTPQAVCPRCGTALRQIDHLGVNVDECPNGHGMWLDRDELHVLAKREEDSWLAKVFRAMSFAKP